MTTFTRYVNTASSTGGDGTTNAVTGANRAYVSLYAAENASATTIADGDAWVFECCGSAPETAAAVVFDHNVTPTGGYWTIAGTGTITVRANRSEVNGFYTGPLSYSLGHYRIETTSGLSAINIQTPNTTIDGIQVKTTGNPAFGAISIANSTVATANVVKNCRLKGQGSTTMGVRVLQASGAGVGQGVYNNIIEGYTTGISATSASSTSLFYIYNNTVVNSTTGVTVGTMAAGAVCYVKNNIFSNCTTAASLTAGSGTINEGNNGYDTGQAGNATGTAVSDWTAEMADVPHKIYRPATGTTLDNDGVGPGSDGNCPADDLLAVARSGSTTQLGALITGGPITAPLFIDYGTASRTLMPNACVPTVPATVIAGDLLVLVLANNDTGSETYTITGVTGWTEYTSGVSVTPQVRIYYLIAAGSEDGATITATPSGGTAAQRGICYRFIYTNASTPLAGGSNTQFSSATITDEGVTTSGSNTLAINVLTAITNETDLAYGPMTGMTGGTWIDQGLSAGTNPNIDLQTAEMPSAGTINGGSIVITATGNKRVFGFYLPSVAGGGGGVVVPIFAFQQRRRVML